MNPRRFLPNESHKGARRCSSTPAGTERKYLSRILFAAIGIAGVFGIAFAQVEPTEQPPAVVNARPTLPACSRPDATVHLYFPDGQLRSSPVRMFVNTALSMNDNPSVYLYSGHALTGHNPAEDLKQPIDLVAPGQSWTEKVNGQEVTNSGTVLLLNLSRYPIEPYKPMRRVTAVLQWQKDKKLLCAVAQGPVNLANAPTAWTWSLAVTVLVLGCIWALAHFRAGSAVELLCADDGHLSLSLTQSALWTIAVGTVTFFYGMIRFEVPTIPDSVLFLMGLSLATAGLGAAAPPQTSPTLGNVPARAAGALDDAAPAQTTAAATTTSPWRISDLVYLFPKSGTARASLSRAQMLFWTVVILVLFVAKSAIDGVLWDVPAGMVALMGLSQAGYVGPKFLGPYSGL